MDGPTADKKSLFWNIETEKEFVATQYFGHVIRTRNFCTHTFKVSFVMTLISLVALYGCETWMLWADDIVVWDMLPTNVQN